MDYDKNTETWMEYYKLTNNQTCGIAFQKNETKKIIYWNVVFAVGDKKSYVKGYIFNNDIGNLTCRTTGKSGLEALVWAKIKLIEFENIPMKSIKKKNKIMVCGEDSRRFRVYKRGLIKNGYKKEYTHSFGWILTKEI